MTTFFEILKSYQKQGKSGRDAALLAFEDIKKMREEEEKKAHKIAKKQKQKEDKERKRDKKQRGDKPLSNLADDAALVD